MNQSGNWKLTYYLSTLTTNRVKKSQRLIKIITFIYKQMENIVRQRDLDRHATRGTRDETSRIIRDEMKIKINTLSAHIYKTTWSLSEYVFIHSNKWQNNYEFYERPRKIARSNSKSAEKKVTRRSKYFYKILTSFILNFWSLVYIRKEEGEKRPIFRRDTDKKVFH